MLQSALREGADQIAFVVFSTEIVEGLVEPTQMLTIASEMDEHGVIFGDGIESDHLSFGYGQRVELRPAAQTLNLLAA